MAPKRGQSSNALSPQISLSPNTPPSPSAIRSTSPSGFTQFLAKPSKWFSRSVSASKIPSSTAESRPSLSSSARKTKISRPTDPRPILGGYSNSQSSKSVLDLSSRPQASFDLPPNMPPSPTIPSNHPNALGDLRNISKRAWSRSADDLSKITSPIAFSPLKSNFQDRVAQYRGRSDSSASAISSNASTSSPVHAGRHPFPSLAGSPPTSSPPPVLRTGPAPRSSTLPTLSVSVSTPTLEDNNSGRNLTPTHVHTRSHSFTPKLPSKLATPISPASSSPKNQGPPKPDESSTVDNDKPIQAPRGFGFGFGNHSKDSASPLHTPVSATPFGGPSSLPTSGTLSSPINHRPTTLLPPPTIIEPHEEQTEKPDPDSKRTSQILLHNGLINRLTDVPANLQHANLQLSKGWKPYKMELKGSKLYFYKPPSDRANAIKDLFPTGLVPPSQEDVEEVVSDPDTYGEDSRRLKGREESIAAGARRKRAYWGRRTHPDLILDADGHIVKGTFEALIHEAVFATTFDHPPPAPRSANANGDQEASRLAPSEQFSTVWKDFASSTLLSLPSLIDRLTFEPEFLRCCSYLISGVEDDARETERTGVSWLANEYLRHYGKPVDWSAWRDWKEETLPGVDLSAEAVNSSSGMPTSASTQAMYPASPINSSTAEFTTFSPRPDNGQVRMVPLLDALNNLSPSGLTRSYEHPYPAAGVPPHLSRVPWNVLHEEGLTKDLLVQLDPHLLARSLILFHRSILEQLPENLTADYLLPPFDATKKGSLATPLATLCGTEEQPHWLTKLLLVQIFGVDGQVLTTGYAAGQQAQGLQSPGRRSEDGRSQQAAAATQTSRTHNRSEIISVWAKVGELCRRAGDECSWRAICAALCSRPVARLDKAWRRVDPQALAIVEMWSYPSSEGQLLTVNDPQVTPWGGDLKEQLAHELAKAKGESGTDQMLAVSAFHKAKSIFEGFRAVFSLCPRNIVVAEDELGEDLKRMVAFWKEVAEGGRTSGLAIKFQRVEQFISLSLAAESRRKGLFEPHFWQRYPQTQPPTSVLIPLLFPEPLAAQTLVDRTHIVRGRVESDTAEMHQYLRGNAHPLQRLDFNPDFTKLHIFGKAGPVISLNNGELLLMVQAGGTDSLPPSRAPSRPTSSAHDASEQKTMSRAPSIRVKPSTSHDLNRKTSIARRSSLPSVSHRQNYTIAETSTEPPLRVIVQAGTLDHLVSILVHGLGHISVSVADDNGEMALLEGKSRELVVDRVEFSTNWWNTFRSFVTPYVFFELLRKLYITSQPVGSSPPVGEYIDVATRRNEVLTTMKEWLTIGGGAQDVLDDSQLYNSVQSFLNGPSDHLVHKADAFDGPTVRQVWAGLQENHKILKACFSSQTMRPTLNRLNNQKRVPGTNAVRTKHTAPREPPDFDRMDPEDFVDNLDGMAYAAFNNVTEEDLYITADLLEVQTSDKTGWFSTKEPASAEEVVEIQSIYSHLQEVEASPLISELGQDALYRQLPPGIRSCIRAFGIIRKWLISRIVTPRLGLRARQVRMELLVQAIEVARLRNAENTRSTPALLQPSVRSFVEAVITSAILSIESRMHHRSWQTVALNRGCQCDSVASLLLRPFVQSTSSTDCLTVDIGWLLERMLEVIASPDVLDPPSGEGQSLINFDKRRHLCNLINKAWSLPATRKHQPSDEANRRGFERLNNIEKEVYHLQFDHRYIREEASRESVQVGPNGPPSVKKAVRPFYKTIAQQLEKNRRDKTLRSRMHREKTMEQSRNERRDDLLNRAMKGPRGKPGSASASSSTQAQQKQHRNKKSMSAFLNFMRPISSAFGADFSLANGNAHSAAAVKKTPAELDFTPSGKPALVLSILDARAAQFINNERSYMFQLETEDGGNYLLQSYSKKDLSKWLDTISKVTQSVAQRRLTYIGSSPKPQIADHIHDRPIIASQDPRAVFGVELEFLLTREAMGGDVAPGTVPRVIEECLNEVERRGLQEVGIYRIAGAALEIAALKDAYNRGESPVKETTDIHAVCDIIKSWFRVLPEPVFPAPSYYQIMEAMRIENFDERLLAIRSVVQDLPQANFDLLRRVAEHLDKVTENEEDNHMTADALAIVFSPNLLRAPQNNFAMILSNMGLSHKLVKAFVTHFHAIFDENDAEVEAQSDDEYEAPIPEEDEDDLDQDDQGDHPRGHEDVGDRSYNHISLSSSELADQNYNCHHHHAPPMQSHISTSSSNSIGSYRQQQYTHG
ncbi:rho GTPase activating protein 22 [Coprinopsis marcescibilis]|uniref:Rho GTPase activating protein 22 n=1 Tax=Coprinopsis marcescibilis TaxID=230819 RepID=A0A5C3L8Z5_COPMA|nr:rho GTPase activating protein 22 [Coprinopsis marcescibilis]